ncbi:MAG: carboxypeptidase-like regulatory domain-containing protein, partial [Mucilaginibacter sp.]
MLKNYKFLLPILLLFILVQAVSAQSVTVKGVVTSKADGLPLPGVSISVKGTTSGTQTDANGNFAITPNINDVLRITYTGFTTQEITVKQSE